MVLLLAQQGGGSSYNLSGENFQKTKVLQNLWIQKKPREIGVKQTIVVCAFQIFSLKKS